MSIYDQAATLITAGLPKVRVVYEDGTRATLRLFRAANGDIGYFGRRKRKRGYLLPNSIQSMTPILKRKTDQQKWEDGWKKVRRRLTRSKLWADMVQDMDVAFEIGYDRLKALYDLYWKLPHDGTQVAAFKTQCPQLVLKNDEGQEYVNTSVLWRFASIPKVKKMRFERGIRNDAILEGIRQAMNNGVKHSAHGRYQYDVSFEYRADIHKAWYSEEFRNCGNGHYYLALDETHALFYEDD